MKISVFTGYKGSRGSTFISVFISLSLIALTLPLLIYLLTLFNQVDHSAEELSIQQFFFFLRDELLQSTNIVVYSDYLEIVNVDNRRISIEKYNDLIRRRVNLQGHEVLLRDVKELEFLPITKGVRVNIELIEGGRLEKDIYGLER